MTHPTHTGHTPTNIELFQISTGEDVYLTSDKKGFAQIFAPIADGDEFDVWERAEFIRRAVNSHDDLVKRLQESTRIINMLWEIESNMVRRKALDDQAILNNETLKATLKEGAHDQKT